MTPSTTSGCENDRLLQLAQEGDETALGQLLESYRKYLAMLARLQIGQRLQGKVDASDVVQETHLGAYRDFAKFRGKSEKEFAGWLRQILVHVLANLVRHYQGTKQRDVRLERRLVAEMDQSSVALAGMIPATYSTPSQHAQEREAGVLLAEALGRMPTEESELILLRHFEGLTFPDVAERMGKTVDSVKKLWPRALARLRRSFKEKFHDGESTAD